MAGGKRPLGTWQQPERGSSKHQGRELSRVGVRFTYLNRDKLRKASEPSQKTTWDLAAT